MGRFDKLGEALRHLRLHGGPRPRKQLEVAAAAAVTRGMLSSYENGHQEPSLKTLDRVLDALGADLAELEWALTVVAIEPRGPGEAAGAYSTERPPAAAIAEPPAVYRTVEVPEILSSDEERVLGQMIAGFLAWLHYTRGQAREE